MDMYLDEAKMLFENFGWYSIILVVITTVLMIPINLLYKKLFKKESLVRLRKMISAISVFIVSFGIVALFTGLVLKQPITTTYLLASCSCCGSLSMVLWAIIKLIRDYGLSPILKAISESKKAKEWLKEVGISEKFLVAITEKVRQYLKDKNIISLEDYLHVETDIISQLRLQVAGFVTSENVHKTITNILQPIKDKLK